MATRLKQLLLVGLLLSGVMGCGPAYVPGSGPAWYGPPAYSYSPSPYGTPSRSYNPPGSVYAYSPAWGYGYDSPRWEQRYYSWYGW
jgi:hypothetical protein